MVDWEGLKALHKKRIQPFQGKNLAVVNDIADSSLAFLKLLDASFPAILAAHERDQRVIEAAEARTQRWIDLIAKHWKQLPTDMQKESDALAEYDKAAR